MEPKIEVLLFDMIGTVVDHRSVIVQEGAEWSRSRGMSVDWPAFAGEWRRLEKRSEECVERGEWPWTNRDEIHRHSLDEMLPRYGLGNLTTMEREQLNRVWDRAQPWPDAIAGLEQLRQRYLLAVLSNSTVASLGRLVHHTGLHFDLILSADLFRAYKPNPKVYQEALRLLNLQPAQVMMVAAHLYDLRGARAAGMRVAFVPRPLEAGPGGKVDLSDDLGCDVVATDFLDLARQLGERESGAF